MARRRPCHQSVYRSPPSDGGRGAVRPSAAPVMAGGVFVGLIISSIRWGPQRPGCDRDRPAGQESFRQAAATTDTARRYSPTCVVNHRHLGGSPSLAARRSGITGGPRPPAHTLLGRDGEACARPPPPDARTPVHRQAHHRWLLDPARSRSQDNPAMRLSNGCAQLQRMPGEGWRWDSVGPPAAQLRFRPRPQTVGQVRTTDWDSVGPPAARSSGSGRDHKPPTPSKLGPGLRTQWDVGFPPP